MSEVDKWREIVSEKRDHKFRHDAFVTKLDRRVAGGRAMAVPFTAGPLHCASFDEPAST